MIYFNLAELKRTTTGIPNEPGEAATENLGNLVKHVLDPLRELAGSPISVNSGFRSAAVNAAVGGSKTSDHMKGLAADIVVGHQFAGLEDHLEVRIAARRLHCDDLVVDLRVAAGEEGAAVDHHVDLVGAGGHGVGRVEQLHRQARPAARPRGGHACHGRLVSCRRRRDARRSPRVAGRCGGAQAGARSQAAGGRPADARRRAGCGRRR